MNKNIVIFTTSVLLGFLSINQYHIYQEAVAKTDRDTSISYAERINLLVATNSELKSEINQLDKKIDEIKSNPNIDQTIEEEIHRLEVLSGDKAVIGPGVKIELDFYLESFWLIDLINELATIGAEAIDINNQRIFGTDGFVADENEYKIYLNQKEEIETPFIINAIGDKDEIYDYLTQGNGFLNRLKNEYPQEHELIRIEKVETIVIDKTD